jgi:hypothetical protein
VACHERPNKQQTTTTDYSSQILMKLELSRQIFEKYLNSIFIPIRLVGAELFRPEDRQDEDHDRFSQF